MPRKKPIKEQIIHSKEYIAFLEKRIASKNYKANVSSDEFDKTKAKLAKERLVLKLLQS